MDIKTAIQSMANDTTIIGRIARDSVNDEDKLIEFVNYIYDQFEQGNGGSMAAKHGFEVINKIVDYAEMLREKKMYSVLTVQDLRKTNKDLKDCLSKYNINYN